MRIIVNGVGIAGPTLAYWLHLAGHDVVLIEDAPALRGGGYIVDFWGVGYDIAEKMRLIPRIRELGYQVREVRFVDSRGRRSGGFPTDVFNRITHDRFTSVLRSDLAGTIYEALNGRVETIFGDSVVNIVHEGPRLRITFEHGASREADLLVGADGLHSMVRQLVFGSEDRFKVSLGYHVAAVEVEDYGPRDELVYVSHGVPGRQVSRFSMRHGRTLLLFVFRDDCLPVGRLISEQERREALTSAFRDVSWECPQMLRAMQDAGAVYFDGVSQIRMNRWTKGRVALVGDAAASVSLMAGEGIGLAMAEAYVLAGELNACGDDYAAAFARYQDRLMPFLKHKQASAARFASFFAPKTRTGLAFRNVASELLGFPFVADWLIGRDLRDDLVLPDYRQ